MHERESPGAGRCETGINCSQSRPGPVVGKEVAACVGAAAGTGAVMAGVSND